MSEPIDTTNDCFVGVTAGGVAILNQPLGAMSKETAIRLAAWLVVLAGDYDGERFREVFEAVCNT